MNATLLYSTQYTSLTIQYLNWSPPRSNHRFVRHIASWTTLSTLMSVRRDSNGSIESCRTSCDSSTIELNTISEPADKIQYREQLLETQPRARRISYAVRNTAGVGSSATLPNLSALKMHNYGTKPPLECNKLMERRKT
jgi:hypothetical protein